MSTPLAHDWRVIVDLVSGNVHAKVYLVAPDKATARSMALEAASGAWVGMSGGSPAGEVRASSVTLLAPVDRYSISRLLAQPAPRVTLIEIYLKRYPFVF